MLHVRVSEMLGGLRDKPGCAVSRETGHFHEDVMAGPHPAQLCLEISTNCSARGWRKRNHHWTELTGICHCPALPCEAGRGAYRLRPQEFNTQHLDSGSGLSPPLPSTVMVEGKRWVPWLCAAPADPHELGDPGRSQTAPPWKAGSLLSSFHQKPPTARTGLSFCPHPTLILPHLDGNWT